MKKYNKPVVEINAIEVNDIITTSLWASNLSDASAKAAFEAFTGTYGEVDKDTEALIFEW